MIVTNYKTWETEEGSVNLSFNQNILNFDLESTHEITRIALENIKGLPNEVLSPKNLSIETISCVFDKIYPKVVKLEDGNCSLHFIDNCFEGMKISVILSGKPLTFEGYLVGSLPGETLMISVSPNNTVLEIKEKIRQLTDRPSEEEIPLFYKDELLKNDETLIYHEMFEGSTLSQEAPKEKNKMDFGFDFNSTEKEKNIKIAKSGPKYLTICKGLNLLGKCPNEDCGAYDQLIVIKKGIGKFDIGYEMFDSICPACEKMVDRVENMGFFNCVYSFEGIQRPIYKEHLEINKKPIKKIVTPAKKITQPKKIAGNQFFTSYDNSGPLVGWSSLNVTTEEKK